MVAFWSADQANGDSDSPKAASTADAVQVDLRVGATSTIVVWKILEAC